MRLAGPVPLDVTGPTDSAAVSQNKKGLIMKINKRDPKDRLGSLYLKPFNTKRSIKCDLQKRRNLAAKNQEDFSQELAAPKEKTLKLVIRNAVASAFRRLKCLVINH